MTKLHDLYDRCGQSPWLDNLRRDYVRGGRLAELVDQGVRGVTSNPTIFAKAIEGEDDYDEQFRQLLADHDVEGAYWELVATDIQEAAEVLAPVHQASGGVDGYVSVEVSPALAHDTAGTVAAARQLHARIARPNVLVKIPATAEGVPAIRQVIAQGLSVNVTLIFSLERYQEVMEAYLAGLEELAAQGTADLSRVRSVASFFVSRVDTEVDRRLGVLADQADPDQAARYRAAMGKAAVAQAQLAYQRFLRTFSGPRWAALAARGAKVQRPLWASTSTKNPAYPDLLYVDQLIGPDTVSTMPDETLAAFLDHGTPARTVDRDPQAAETALETVGELGIDLADVARVLEAQGVAAFGASFDDLLAELRRKAAALAPGRQS
ncbi:transaldolase [Aciditerrimonas ferrireducens]|uniref:Transaldolase n=2 Tax=Aciditerrimonas ferrireducens TaxID=667306 RepID=A0ABV6C2A3_9ACTN